MSQSQHSRRAFLQGVAAGGILLAAGTVPGAQATTANAAGAISQWVHISETGAVTILTNTSELGQGSSTALAQILANELDLDWQAITLKMAPLEARFANPGLENEFATFGSGGVAGNFAALRKAGAQARAMLLAGAAAQWHVAVADCDTHAGEVVCKLDQRRMAYAKLVPAAARVKPPAQPVLMPPERWQFVGKSMPRLDLPAKVDGSAVYGIDVTMDGLLVATINQCPSFGGRLQSVDTAPALAVRGVKQVIKMHDAVAVVASNYWAAKKGLAALSPQWDLRGGASRSSDAYARVLESGATRGGVIFPGPKSTIAVEVAKFDSTLATAQATVSALYQVPFLAHATMEPMNATARVTATHAELWLPTQTQQVTRDAVARELGLLASAISIHTTLAGGGFGRRLEFDFVLQVVRIAKQVAAPVKLIWSREEDIQHDFYRPAAAVQLTAGVDAQGLPIALRLDSACESLVTYTRGGIYKAEALPVDTTALGATPSHYRIKAFLRSANTIDIGVPVGYWRSVESSQNCFAIESFIDELAVRGGTDPLAFRSQLLDPKGRAWAVLNRAAQLSDWAKPPPPGQFRGLALVRANGSVVVHVVRLSVGDSNRVRIHHVTTVVDCGLAVNPGSVNAQMEGGIAFGLSAAFYGEITIKDGAVQQSNFHDYRLIGLADMPAVTVEIMASTESPSGAGEEAVGPIAPAVANALFAATGKRIRTLPFAKAGFELG